MSEEREYKSMYYNAATVMRNVPEIMGLDLKQKPLKSGFQWEGPYRLSGARCGHRRDKMKVFAWKGCVWVQEEGEPLMSIQRWLVEHGGCADYRQAGRVLRLCDPAKRMQECVIARAQARVEDKCVDWLVWEGYRREHELDRCQLYTWMCRLFGEELALGAFDLYKATTNERGEMVYWYVDVEGRICHDKVMSYRHDGHRDKSRGGWRRYTTTLGYTGRCYYGSHLIEEACSKPGWRVMVVEGEKTAMMCSIAWPEYTWIATGGKNQLRDVENGWTLLPDVDAADAWAERGSVSRWWDAWDGGDGCGCCGERSDIGDMVEAYVRACALDKLRTAEMRRKLFHSIR